MGCLLEIYNKTNLETGSSLETPLVPNNKEGEQNVIKSEWHEQFQK